MRYASTPFHNIPSNLTKALTSTVALVVNVLTNGSDPCKMQ